MDYQRLSAEETDLLTERHKAIAGKIWEIANRLRGPTGRRSIAL